MSTAIFRVHDANGVGVGLLRLVPYVAPVLPQELVGRCRKEVVSLADLEFDAIEIVVGRFAGQHVALLTHEEFADIPELIPGDRVHLLGRAGQFVLVLRHEILLLRLVAENILAIVGDDEVRHLREAVELVGFVRIRRIGRFHRRVQILEHRLQGGIGIDILIDLEVVATLDEGAEPLAVGHRHIVLLLAGGQRGIEAGIVVRPWNEIEIELYIVARGRLILFVE